MKVWQLIGALAVAAVAVDARAKYSQSDRPGYCDEDQDCWDLAERPCTDDACKQRAKEYTCVSVQTTRDKVEDVKQCLPFNSTQPVCTGILPGLCPSFSTTWGEEFRQISSVCAYIVPDKKTKCLKDGAAATKGAVQCIQVEDPDEEGETIGVIYGCVDFDGTSLLFEDNSKSDRLAQKSNYSEIVLEKCRNPSNPEGASFVCSSQGTCAPTGKGNMDYACKCNIGFQGKYCEKIVSNACYNDGVCGGDSTCNLVNQVCECEAGLGGLKCSECDPNFSSPCKGNGQCVAATGDSTLGASESSGNDTVPSNTTVGVEKTRYQCKCNKGYSGLNCETKVAGKQKKTKKSTSTDGSAPAAVPAPSASVATALSVAAAALALVASAAL